MGQDYEKVLAKCFEKVNYMNDRLDGFPHITRKSSWLTNQHGRNDKELGNEAQMPHG